MTPLTILVVDDQPIMREVVSQILEDEGHNVRVASDGTEALRKLGHAHYDLLITDVVMPGMDGIELISEALRRHPMLRVIAMSAGDGLFSKINCLEIASRVGAGAVLTKPFERSDLARAIEELCPSDSFALR